MSDIFISYASEDRQYAEIVAQALEQRGWRVWWDPQISPGKEWDEVIGEELRVTRCVVVLWSQYSVQSRWVKAEANVGLEREILVPAVIENKVQIPWAFRRIEAAQLVDWLKKQGSVRNQEFDQFVEAIAERIGIAPVGPVVETKPQRGGQFNLKWLSFALTVVVVGVLAFIIFPLTKRPIDLPPAPVVTTSPAESTPSSGTATVDEATKKQVQDYLGMAEFYLEEKELDDANAQIDAAKAIAPNHPDVQTMLKRVQSAKKKRR